jgi:hypothetical protein
LISRAPSKGGSGIRLSVRAAERGGAAHGRLLAQLPRLAADPLDQRRSRPGVDQGVHRVEPLEGVLAVEDAGFVDLVGLLPLRVEHPPAEVAVDRGAADQHRELQPALVQLLDADRHLLRGRDEQRREADRVGLVLDRRLDDRLDRDLLAEVDHRVAVVGQDRVDQRLADVVDVAEHGRDHDLALAVALDPVEVSLQPGDCALHHFRRLQDEGQDQFAGAELVADLLHRRQQHLVEGRDGADLLVRAVDPLLDPLLLAAQDVPVQRLLGLHPLGLLACLLGRLLALRLEVGDEALQRVIAPVEDEVVGQLALGVGDLRVGGDVVGVDHRQVEPGLDAVVQEDRVERGAGRLADAEGDVGDAKRGLDARDLRLDPADPLDRLHRRGLPLVVAGGQGEGERVEDQQLGVEPVLAAGQVADPLGDLELALGRLRHPDLVDRQRDQRRPVRLGQRDDDVGLVRARLEVDRVDDRPPRNLFQRGLDHLGLGRVDLDRRRLGQRDPLDHGHHLLVLVGALGQRHAEVEHVGTAFDLVFGDLDQAVVVVGQQQLLRFARALRVDPLADQGRARLLDQRRRGHHRGEARRARGGALAGDPAVDPLADRRDVLRRRAAAAADDPDPVALDELTQRRRQRAGLFGEDRLAVGPLQGQAGVGDAVDGQRAVLAEEADRLAHVLRPGRAVEADHVDLERAQRRQHRVDVGSEQHLAAVGEQRDAGLDRQRAAGLGEGLAGAEDRRLDLEDVLRGLDDDQVGTACDQPLRLLCEDLDQLAEGDLAEGRVVGGGQEPGRPDRAGDEALLAGRLAGDLRRLRVDLERLLAEAPLLELQPRALEAVGLDHLGAGREHRGVDPLDHVGPVEHECLVAFAREAAVVGLGQLELLQGGAHAAVEDDDAFPRGGYVIALGHGQGGYRGSNRAPLRLTWL